MDVNGSEMHDLFRFAKRSSGLFNPKLGRAPHIYDHHSKFLANRYGQVKHYYHPSVELAIIERDIRNLISEEYFKKRY